MMKKPAMKRKLAITSSMPSMKAISFYADKDISDLLEEFGKVFSRAEEGFPDSRTLYVDPRFEFKEVMEYMKALNGDGKQDGEEE